MLKEKRKSQTKEANFTELHMHNRLNLHKEDPTRFYRGWGRTCNSQKNAPSGLCSSFRKPGELVILLTSMKTCNTVLNVSHISGDPAHLTLRFVLAVISAMMRTIPFQNKICHVEKITALVTQVKRSYWTRVMIPNSTYSSLEPRTEEPKQFTNQVIDSHLRPRGSSRGSASDTGGQSCYQEGQNYSFSDTNQC